MLDALDQKILGQLLVSSDLTSAELGEKVGLSPSAAHRRVGSLKDRGLIAGFRAVLSKAARGNPSVEAVLSEGLPYTSGPAWLYQAVLRGRHVLAIAGISAVGGRSAGEIAERFLEVVQKHTGKPFPADPYGAKGYRYLEVWETASGTLRVELLP